MFPLANRRLVKLFSGQIFVKENSIFTYKSKRQSKISGVEDCNKNGQSNPGINGQ